MTRPKVTIDAPRRTCVVCGREFFGYGNNADPVAIGICCDECNTIVVARRVMRLLWRRGVLERTRIVKADD